MGAESVRALTELVPVPSGRFLMGSQGFYADEGPERVVEVDEFRIERHPVTNRQYAVFVEETGYVTVAERPPDPDDFPGADPAVLVPGGLVFTPTSGPVPLTDWSQWWRWQPGASWRSPEGPGSTVRGREDHPVVMVAFDDVTAYAQWAGRQLPTEVEFEYAARGGTSTGPYAWGAERAPGGQVMANTWHGRFPHVNEGARGWAGTSPVGTFPPNGYGLVDVIGNVWEWTTTLYATGADRDRADALARTGITNGVSDRIPDPGGGDESGSLVHACCAPQRDLSMTSGVVDLERASRAPGETQPRRVLKGGSHLCAPEYCLRYRPPARSPQSVDSATSHIGFRCVVRP
jgi:sulfatase modifying factor 1